MAHVYIWSGATGTGTGATWANAYVKTATALAAKAAGDNFWVAHDHAESEGAAITLTSPGSVTAPCTVMCVNRAGSVPPVSADLRTTGVIACGAGGFQLTIGSGNTYWYGLTFKSGTGAVDWGIALLGTGWWSFKNCVLWKPGTVPAASAINLTGSYNNDSWGILLDNTQMRFGHVDDSLRLGNRVIWQNTATSVITTEAVPDSLINYSDFSQVLITGNDFSGCASTTLFRSVIGTGNVELRNVKLHASTSLSILGQLAGRELNVINTDSTGTNYRSERHTYYGDQTTETTIIRTGGATDGVTPIAWKIITGANVSRVRPFRCLPMAVWNDTAGSTVTLTIYGIWGGGSVPTSADLWPIVSYMGSSGSPLATIAGEFDLLETPANWTADGSTWGGSTTAFKMVKTLSAPAPAMKGPIYIEIMVAAASTTLYLDPKPVLS